jgi:hypothetical protein
MNKVDELVAVWSEEERERLKNLIEECRERENRSPSTLASYGFRNGQIGSSFPDQSLLRLPGIDPRTYPKLATSGASRRALFYVIHLSPLRSIFSPASGYQREKAIAAYREAEGFQTIWDERAFRVFDIYV